MRTELESRLVFAAPSELLVAAPVSAASQRLLGAYTAQVRPSCMAAASQNTRQSHVHSAGHPMLYVTASILFDMRI